MSEEIEAVDEMEEIDEVQEDQDIDESSEIEEEAPAEPKKVEFDAEQQEVFNREIGRKSAQVHEERRKAEAAQARIAELEAAIPKTERPEVPPIPDQYDEDYAKKIEARDKAISEAASFDAAERIRSEGALKQQQEAQRIQQEEFNKGVSDYTDRAVKLGIKPEELQAAGSQLNQYGIDDQVAAYILDEAIGPQITVYLSKNPALMDEISRLSPINAVAKIAAEIKPLAAAMSKQVKLPGDPTETLSGMGAKGGISAAIAKATFE